MSESRDPFASLRRKSTSREVKRVEPSIKTYWKVIAEAFKSGLGTLAPKVDESKHSDNYIHLGGAYKVVGKLKVSTKVKPLTILGRRVHKLLFAGVIITLGMVAIVLAF